jgi:hypothetical protein
VWELAFEGAPDLNVYRNRNFQPRVHLMGTTRIVPDQEAAFATLHDPAFQPLTEVILEGGEALTGPGGAASITSWGVNDVWVDTSSEAPGVLLMAQTWYPGWQARVDGGDWQPVLRADAAFQAVPVPAGQHTVELRFRSLRQTWGIVIALLTLVIVAVLMIFDGRRRRKATD